MPRVLPPVFLLAATLFLGCGDNNRAKGEVAIATTYAPADTCPSISGAVAAPSQTSVGGAIAVSASASDPDPGDVLGYSWSPPAAFANPAAAATSFTCASAGLKTLTVTVSDHHRADPCTATATLHVTCVAGKSAPGL
jgi:hypothetical protein